MTSSRDSLIPDTKPRSEAEARIEAALKVAQGTLDADTWNRDPSYRAHLLKIALQTVRNILEDGK